MPGFIQTAALMFREIRRERRDLFILIIFALVLFLVADGILGWLIRLLSPEVAADWAAWRPDVRPHAVGAAAGLALVLAVLRPFWREARSRLKSESGR